MCFMCTLKAFKGFYSDIPDISVPPQIPAGYDEVDEEVNSNKNSFIIHLIITGMKHCEKSFIIIFFIYYIYHVIYYIVYSILFCILYLYIIVYNISHEINYNYFF